jgi:hypothetical protein
MTIKTIQYDKVKKDSPVKMTGKSSTPKRINIGHRHDCWMELKEALRSID